MADTLRDRLFDHYDGLRDEPSDADFAGASCEFFAQWLRSDEARQIALRHQPTQPGGGCLCGWNNIGESRVGHMLAALADKVEGKP